MKETKITFKLESDHYVSILLNGKEVGHLYSQLLGGSKPFPHEDTEYCNTSIQICGFDKCSEVWPCGVFYGKKDLVVNFSDYNTKYMKQEEKQYRTYVQDFLNKGADMNQLVAFQEWVSHLGHPRVSSLKRKEQEE